MTGLFDFFGATVWVGLDWGVKAEVHRSCSGVRPDLLLMRLPDVLIVQTS